MSLIDTVRRYLPVKYRELAKFLVVGGTAYVVDVGLFTVLSHTVLSNKVITAKAISVIIATILSYILNREWSFSRRGGREKHHEAMLFFLVNGIAMALNLVPLALSQYVFGFNTTNYSSLTVSITNFISANVIGTILGMAFRFWAYRKWVFPEELAEHPGLLDEAEVLAEMHVEAERRQHAEAGGTHPQSTPPVPAAGPEGPNTIASRPVVSQPVHSQPVISQPVISQPVGSQAVEAQATAELPTNRRSA
ncbi:GtrA family protein [Nakamurella sp. GG22]